MGRYAIRIDQALLDNFRAVATKNNLNPSDLVRRLMTYTIESGHLGWLFAGPPVAAPPTQLPPIVQPPAPCQSWVAKGNAPDVFFETDLSPEQEGHLGVPCSSVPIADGQDEEPCGCGGPPTPWEDACPMHSAQSTETASTLAGWEHDEKVGNK